MPIVNAAPHKQGCCSASDAADARRVADQLDIPFHALNFKDAFGRIKDYFVDEYLASHPATGLLVMKDGQVVGYLTSSAFGHRVGHCVALGYMKGPHAGTDKPLSIDILGKRRSVKLLFAAAFDPSASRMKS